VKAKMTERDYELLSQHLDGELPVERAQELRARLLAEPSLRAKFERLKSADSRVRSAFDVSGIDAVPAHVVQMVRDTETHAGKDLQKMRAGWGVAVAASVIAAAGVLLNPGESGQSLDHKVQTAHQDTLLSPVLEQSLSSGDGWVSLGDGSRVRPLLSFSSVEGGWCREYLLTDEGSKSRGVACRSAGQWITAVLVAEDSPGGVNEYRPAGAPESDLVASFIDHQSADIPLSREQEAELIARGWQ
jgi:hypothetical protein